MEGDVDCRVEIEDASHTHGWKEFWLPGRELPNVLIFPAMVTTCTKLDEQLQPTNPVESIHITNLYALIN